MHEIITTIGPASFDEDIIKKLVSAGATDFRINLSHSTEASLEEFFQLIEGLGIKPALDTQGAQLRVAGYPSKCRYDEGEIIKMSGERESNSVEIDIKLNHEEVIKQIKKGDRLKIDSNGLIVEIQDIDIQDLVVTAIVKSSGNVGGNKAVDVIDRKIRLNALTELDIFAIKKYASRASCIYLSFTNCPEDVIYTRSIIDEVSESSNLKSRIRIISKIESRAGIANLNEILEVVDGILIDRGDLSREISISKIPIACNLILARCKEVEKPCFIATDVLENMLINPLPSRAEISDLYNLFSRGVSGIVLAAEVAVGKYPVECVHVVKYMSKLYEAERTGLHWFMPDSKNRENLPKILSDWL